MQFQTAFVSCSYGTCLVILPFTLHLFGFCLLTWYAVHVKYMGIRHEYVLRSRLIWFCLLIYPLFQSDYLAKIFTNFCCFSSSLPLREQAYLSLQLFFGHDNITSLNRASYAKVMWYFIGCLCGLFWIYCWLMTRLPRKIVC